MIQAEIKSLNTTAKRDGKAYTLSKSTEWKNVQYYKSVLSNIAQKCHGLGVLKKIKNKFWLYHMWNCDGNWQCYRDGKIRVKAHLSIYLQSWNDLRRTGPQAILLKFNKQKQRYIVFLHQYWLSHHLFHSVHVKIFYRDISLNKEQKLTAEIFREKAKQASTSINENAWSGWSSREVSILLI